MGRIGDIEILDPAENADPVPAGREDIAMQTFGRFEVEAPMSGFDGGATERRADQGDDDKGTHVVFS
jgi:hypothetical protein